MTIVNWTHGTLAIWSVNQNTILFHPNMSCVKYLLEPPCINTGDTFPWSSGNALDCWAAGRAMESTPARFNHTWYKNGPWMNNSFNFGSYYVYLIDLIHLQCLPFRDFNAWYILLKRKCCYFEESFITGSESCRPGSCQSSQWRKCHHNENDIFFSVILGYWLQYRVILNRIMTKPYSICFTVYTEAGVRCVFPFVYETEIYYNCTTGGGFSGIPYCATVSTLAFGDQENWGYCDLYRRYQGAVAKSRSSITLISCGNRYKILHRERQCYYHALCKISKRLGDYVVNYGQTIFRLDSSLTYWYRVTHICVNKLYHHWFR